MISDNALWYNSFWMPTQFQQFQTHPRCSWRRALIVQHRSCGITSFGKKAACMLVLAPHKLICISFEFWGFQHRVEYPCLSALDDGTPASKSHSLVDFSVCPSSLPGLVLFCRPAQSVPHGHGGKYLWCPGRLVVAFLVTFRSHPESQTRGALPTLLPWHSIVLTRPCKFLGLCLHIVLAPENFHAWRFSFRELSGSPTRRGGNRSGTRSVMPGMA